MPRFERGTIQPSEHQDIPLLRQILHSIYSTKQQLYGFMALEGRERSLKSFHNRLQRLVKHGLVRRHDALSGLRTSLYSIGSAGLELLIDYGEPYAGRGSGLDCPTSKAQHALRLNDMHLALARDGALREWLPESEICSRNILTAYGFAKDYDAVVVIQHNGKKITFALEYERSQKTDAEYQGITIALNRESQVDFVLYLVTTKHLMSKVASSLRNCRQKVAIGMAQDFSQHLFESFVSVIDNRLLSMRLRELMDVTLVLRNDSSHTGTGAHLVS